MSVRFRKSIGLGHGMRLTLGKHGVSASGGVPGYRASFHSSGRVTRTVGIPGTGVYSVYRVDGGSAKRRARTAQPAQTAHALKKPGLFAGKSEKRYYEAVVAFLEGRDSDVLVATDEVYQLDGRLDEAIGLVQQLDTVTPGDPVVRLSLCDLLVADKDYDGALETSADAINDGDVGVATLRLRGAALFGLGQPGAAAQAFTAALAKRVERDPGLLLAVRYDRALTYLAAGQKSKARADFEKIMAADPTYLDVSERLQALA